MGKMHLGSNELFLLQYLLLLVVLVLELAATGKNQTAILSIRYPVLIIHPWQNPVPAARGFLPFTLSGHWKKIAIQEDYQFPIQFLLIHPSTSKLCKWAEAIWGWGGGGYHKW